jgi:hypothetical protein
LDYNGASAKETQELARHSTPVVTFASYVRARGERMREVVEELGEAVKVADSPQHSPNAEAG